MSPLVSYHFHDSMEAPPPQSNVVSPLASYVFHEWPGDENLEFNESQKISYFYHDNSSSWYTGRITSNHGIPIDGATVTLKQVDNVFWTGQTDTNGYFSVPGLGNDFYVVIVQKEGFLGEVTTSDGRQHGIHSLRVKLTALPEPSPTQDVIRDPPISAIGDVSVGTSSLRVFKNGSFSKTNSFAEDEEFSVSRPTIILSHGWLSSVENWPTLMASRIRNRLGPNSANILAWDWNVEADGSLVGRIDVAAVQGEHLGAKLRQELGDNYSNHLHFIGHSFGTIVNAYACDYLHGRIKGTDVTPVNGWSVLDTTPHLTLMDEAELGEVLGGKVILSAAIGALVAGEKGALVGYGIGLAKSPFDPIPDDFAWIDNYVSAVGRYRGEAVNVGLFMPVLTLQGPIDAHRYANQWYSNSVLDFSGSGQLGFRVSREAGSVFPPSGLGMKAGESWYEFLASDNPYDVIQNPTADDLDGLFPAPIDYPLITSGLVITNAAIVDTSALIVETADTIGNEVLNAYESRIEFAGEVGGTVIYKSGQVISSTKEKVGLWWNAAFDEGGQFLNSIDPEAVITGPVNAPVIKMLLRTTPSLAADGLLARTEEFSSFSEPSSPGIPAFAWMTVDVPEDAYLMAFDFTVSGDPQQDLIVCAVDDQNVFTLPARFAPDGQIVSTDLIDISDCAGKTVEFFFGLTGGTSVNCELAIEGVRFIRLPTPKLAIKREGGGSGGVKWPAAATGWSLQYSDTLDSDSWMDVPPDAQISVEAGVSTFPFSTENGQIFFRLKKNSQE